MDEVQERPGIDPGRVTGAIIIKQKLNLSDEEAFFKIYFMIYSLFLFKFQLAI